jgi:uroporphyrinogen decarboxylase
VQDSRELISNLLSDRPADRMALAENIWGQTLQRWLEEGYPTDGDGKPADPIEHFGFDMGGVGLGLDLMPKRGVSEVLEETDEWIIRRNGAGAALKRWKQRVGTPQHIDFLMTSRQVWERDYRHHLLEPDRDRLNLAGVAEGLARRREQGRWAFMGSMFIWELMRQSLGDTCMYESLLDDPAWIRDYNRVYTDFFRAHYEIVFEEVGKPDGIRLCEDLGYKNGLFCSPEVMGELIFPYYAEIVDFFHSHDLPVILHACGGVGQALNLIVEAGFDGLDPMEVNAGCDVFAFAERCESKLMLRGGFNKVIVESGDRDFIRRQLTDFLRRIKDAGIRYVFSVDHSVSTNTSYDAYSYAVQVYRENMMY